MIKAFPLRPASAMVLAAIFLAGCSLAPKYEQPLAPIPQSYSDENGADVTSGVNTADLGWSEFFNDERLKFLIGLALDNNRDLRVALHRVSEAQAMYGIAQSDRFPTVGIGGNAQLIRTPENMRGSDAESVSRTYMAGVALTSFEIDFFGRVKSLSDAAYQSYLATQQAHRTVHINLVAQVAEAYFRYRSALELQNLVNRTLASRQKTYDLVKQRFDMGVASALDTSQAKVQLDSARADLSAVQRQSAQALNVLELLIGTSIPAEAPEADVFGKNQLMAQIPAGLPSDLLVRRPDILAAENRLKAANANIGAARAAFLPNISITGLLGFASPQLGGLFGSGNRYWQYSPQIALPIFGGAQSGNLDLAEARKNIAVAEYEKTIQTAFREVSDALAGEATFSPQLDALRDLESSSMQALDLARMRYETGIDSFLQLQTAEVNLYAAQQQFIQTGMLSLLNRIELYKALGGGWLTETNFDTLT